MAPIAASRSPPGVQPRGLGASRSLRARPTSRGLSSDPGAGLSNARWDGWGSSRLSKDYERQVQTSETLLQLAMIRLMVRRLARSIV